MGLSTKDNINSERKMDTDNFYGLIGRATTVISLTTTSTAKERIRGPTAEFTMATGNKIKCTGKVSLLGQMVANMKVDITMIISKGMESSTGRMDASMMGTGW